MSSQNGTEAAANANENEGTNPNPRLEQTIDDESLGDMSESEFAEEENSGVSEHAKPAAAAESEPPRDPAPTVPTRQ